MKTKRTFLRTILYLLACASIVFALLTCAYADSSSFIDNPEAISSATDSVVMLYCYDKSGELIATGSGFAAIEDGLIITNYHVISDGVYRVRAETEGKLSFELEYLVAADEKNDIAILKTSTRTGLRLLPLGSNKGMLKGSKVIAIGSPEGYLNVVTSGLYSGVQEIEERELIRFDAAITHGSSGGALFNNSGEVIGITCGSIGDGFLLNMAVPIEKVTELYSHSSEQNVIKLTDFYSENEEEEILSFGISDLDMQAYNGVWASFDGVFEMYIPSDWKAHNTEDMVCSLSSPDEAEWIDVVYHSPSEARKMGAEDITTLYAGLAAGDSDYAGSFALINDIFSLLWIDDELDYYVVFYDADGGLYGVTVYSIYEGGAVENMANAENFLYSMRARTNKSTDVNALFPSWREWSDWSSAPVYPSSTREVETRECLKGYNMIVYVTQEDNYPKYYRNFRDFSIKGKLDIYGARQSYGEKHFEIFVMEDMLKAASVYAPGDFVYDDGKLYVGGYNKSSYNAYVMPIPLDAQGRYYPLFIDSMVTEIQYRYRDKN